MGKTTINQLLFDSFRRHDKSGLFWHKQESVWRKISTATFLSRAASLAQALEAMGVRKGDRVGLFSENRPEWHVVDLACLGRGIITVPIYQAESAERLAYILQHSEARFCFTSGPEQLAKVRVSWEHLPQLERVISFGSKGCAGGEERLVPWEQVARDDFPEDRIREFERAAQEQQPDDVVTLIYTSGTTGIPKGTLITQHNFGSNVQACYGLWGTLTDDLELSLLPLCHIFERNHCYVSLVHGASVAYAEGFDQVTDNMLEIRPTVMAVVPRFFEKFYSRLMERVQAAPALKRKLFEWAARVGREALPYRLQQKPLPGRLAVRYRVADRFVYRKVRDALGSRVKHFISGGAPLARDLNEFFHALGLVIYEGYGLTETSPVIAVNIPGATKLGTVGRPIAGVEVKIADDGEILTRGPHVMAGYYKMEKETREVLDDGWFHTGDVGFLDSEGYLSITDRKKDLIKTAGGKMLAPQGIENRLKASPYIQTAVVIGDRRRFPIALLVPNFPTLERHAELQGIPSRSRKELVEKPEIRALLEGEVEAVNCHLAQYERIKRFAVLDREFSFAEGQLTYTQKVRRRQVEEEYRELIERLYQEEVPSTA